MPIIKLHPGGRHRLNPLDPAPGDTAPAAPDTTSSGDSGGGTGTSSSSPSDATPTP